MVPWPGWVPRVSLGKASEPQEGKPQGALATGGRTSLVWANFTQFPEGFTQFRVNFTQFHQGFKNFLGWIWKETRNSAGLDLKDLKNIAGESEISLVKTWEALKSWFPVKSWEGLKEPNLSQQTMVGASVWTPIHWWSAGAMIEGGGLRDEPPELG